MSTSQLPYSKVQSSRTRTSRSAFSHPPPSGSRISNNVAGLQALTHISTSPTHRSHPPASSGGGTRSHRSISHLSDLPPTTQPSHENTRVSTFTPPPAPGRRPPPPPTTTFSRSHHSPHPQAAQSQTSYLTPSYTYYTPTPSSPSYLSNLTTNPTSHSRRRRRRARSLAAKLPLRFKVLNLLDDIGIGVFCKPAYFLANYPFLNLFDDVGKFWFFDPVVDLTSLISTKNDSQFDTSTYGNDKSAITLDTKSSASHWWSDSDASTTRKGTERTEKDSSMVSFLRPGPRVVV